MKLNDGFIVYPWVFFGKGYKLSYTRIFILFIVTLVVSVPTNIYFISRSIFIGYIYEFYPDGNTHQGIILNFLLYFKNFLFSFKPTELIITYGLRFTAPLFYFFAYIHFHIQTWVWIVILGKKNKD